MAIVVNLQLGRSLAAVGPHDAVVEFLDETRRAARDPVILPICHVRLPAHVDSAVNEAYIEYRRLCGATVKPSGTDHSAPL